EGSKGEITLDYYQLNQASHPRQGKNQQFFGRQPNRGLESFWKQALPYH
ncbi:9025_t:CDS:1, partial [Funneliformis geosporum]